MRSAKLALVCNFLLFLLLPALANAQSPTWDRSVREIAIGDADATGGRRVSALIDIHAAGSTAPLDLSLELEYRVLRGGTVVEGGLVLILLFTEGALGDCETSCGSGCGGLYVDGVFNTMLCHVDGPIPGGGVDCDCGYWLTADVGTVDLRPEDEIMILLRPAPGALPDADTSNDVDRRIFDGKSVGWHRDLRDVSIVDSATGRGADVTAFVDLHAAGLSTEMDLSTEVEVLVNGTPVASQSWVISNSLGGGTGDCESSCGSGCGGLYVDGHINTMTCHIDGVAPGGVVDCDCGYWLAANFPGVPAAPGDEIMVLLRPAPGAVPDASPDDPHVDWIEILSTGNAVNTNRRVRSISVVPSSTGPSGSFDVTPVLGLEVAEIRHALDLSTEVELLVNGASLSRIQIDAAALGPSASCEISCGSNCGPLYVDGVFNSMLCRLDGLFPGGGADCDCGYWLAPSFPGVELQPEDEIMILLRPAPGALPEVDPSDDVLRRTFDGSTSGWNRGVRSLQVTPSPTGGSDVVAEIYAAVSDPDDFHDLSFEVQLESGGVVIASEIVALQVVPVTSSNPCQVDCSGGGCADFQSPSQHEWITPACAVYEGFVGCTCGSTLSLSFEGITIPETGNLKVLLIPAPGALPELPGFPEDDERRPDPGSTSAPGRGKASPQLGHNHPNPFNPSTTIAFELPRAGEAVLEVYDLRGSRVRTLVSGELSAGTHTATWNGRDDEGRSVASGTYLFRLQAGGVEQSRKAILVK